MLTLKAAAELLAAKGSDALVAIAATCGYEGPPLPMAPLDRAALGLAPPDDPCAIAVHVARGPDALRALLIDVVPDGPPRALHDIVSRVAARLARRAPHLAWLCIARVGTASEDRRAHPHPGRSNGAHSARQLVLATWSSERQPPRIAALVVDPDAVVDSDAETLAALAAAVSADTAGTHARWLDLLGRESLTRRFYIALNRAVDALAGTTTVASGMRSPPPHTRRELALLCASRLLFLAFLEAKGWLDRDRSFLARIFADCMTSGGDFHARVLRPLFFGTLNTPFSRRSQAAIGFGHIPFLNGGLFSPTALERRSRGVAFSDAALGDFVGGVLGHYRFTAREDRSTWSEAAIDPEMLGRSFEALMAPSVRHATGAYYTPQALVARVTEHALVHALASAAAPPAAVAALLRGDPAGPAAHEAVHHRLSGLRVLDPACGSGAFLVHMLDLLATLAGRVGIDLPVSQRRRQVLTRSIFGVDINPTAVWLCELRLWLAVVIDSPDDDPVAMLPLPNLDRNVRVGDALAGGAFGGEPHHVPTRTVEQRSAVMIGRLRERYARSTGVRKRSMLRTLERIERSRALERLRRELASVMHARIDAVTLARGRDLFGAAPPGGAGERARRSELRKRARALRSQIEALRGGAALPFAFATHFGDVDDAGGFDLVLGNPPWVRPHAVPIVDRERLRRDFAVCRHGAWLRGATAGRSGPGFGTQVDMAAIFVERALTVARPHGIVALLLPAKLWRCLAGGGVRSLILDRASLLRIEDWSGARRAFDAAVYPSLLVVRRVAQTSPGREAVASIDAQ